MAASLGRAGRNVVGVKGVSQYRAAVSNDGLAMPDAAVVEKNIDNIPVAQENPKPIIPDVDPELEEIKRQREICISNNIGVGNTFVWAAKNSDITNYMNMIEDVENPKNNTCYVKVDIRTTDDRIYIADILPKYFEMGRALTCASWVDESMLEKRILDGKKKARNWGIAASVVGGAGVGVGAMELFGNKLIGGKVMGQKALEGQELIVSQIKVLQKENPAEYKRIIDALENLDDGCKQDVWDGNVPTDCDVATNPFIGLRDKLK